MRCTSPRTVGFLADGKTISWSQKHYSKEYATFQLPCGKCLECRLEYARQWAVRCVHEAQMFKNNCFVTLTYSDENLKSDKLDYRDFQLFVMRLRSKIRYDIRKSYGPLWKKLSKTKKKEIYETDSIGFFVTGEYGEETKRPHWHAIIFNWYPSDATYFRSNERGDRIFKSDLLDGLWSSGHSEIGSVTFDSAGYCARYAAKKLVHGRDEEHDFHPISKKSSKHAIGKKWVEAFHDDAFNHGYIVLPDGATCSIPRYYQKWLQKHKPEKWRDYVTQTKQKAIIKAQESSEKQRALECEANSKRRARNPFAEHVITKNEVRKKIKQQKFKQLQENLKL